MKTSSFIKGLLIGGAGMYFFDPERGRRRRALVRDQATHQLNLKREDLRVMQRDFSNRTRGMVHSVQARIQGDHPDDTVLVERVRSAAGRCCTQTHGLSVYANEGIVTLAGPVLANEVQDLVGTIKNVRGVTRVINDLEIHESAESIGQGKPTTDRLNPAECFASVCGGAILGIYGLGRRGIFGWLVSGAGLALIAKGFNDTEKRFDPIQDPSGSTPSRSEETANA